MNYTWMRADWLKIGVIVYRSRLDSVLVWIEEAGSLHLRLHYADQTSEVVYRNAPVMVQCCHRRRYEGSTHHRPLDPGKAMVRVWRKRRTHWVTQ